LALNRKDFGIGKLCGDGEANRTLTRAELGHTRPNDLGEIRGEEHGIYAKPVPLLML
jgi:hypothetical protein